MPTPITPQNLMEIGLPDHDEMDRFCDAFQLDTADRDHWAVYFQSFAFNTRAFLPTEPQQEFDGLVDFA